MTSHELAHCSHFVGKRTLVRTCRARRVERDATRQRSPIDLGQWQKPRLDRPRQTQPHRDQRDDDGQKA
jgi:hypothetical protein